jgi:DNA-binding response OmpR family regulator
MRILAVDDDEMLLDAIAESLRDAWPGCEVACVVSAAEALSQLATFEPDLVLLDVGLPDESGHAILKRVRQFSDVPVIMISGRGLDLDEIQGLQLGADDFIAKPFSQNLLIARIKSLLRRSDRPPRDRVPDRVVGELAMDFHTREVTLRGEPVKLTPVEYKLLYQLARGSGRLLPHDSLLESVWGKRSSAATLHVYIKRLRDKIEDGTPVIENERGAGYRLILPVQRR